MEKERKERDRFPYINQDIALSSHGVFYHKPIRIPAVIDENGVVMPSDKSSQTQAKKLEEHWI